MDEKIGWLAPMEKLIRDSISGYTGSSSATSVRIPILGICFGGQLIAKAVYGRDAVGKMSRGEFGYRKIELIEQETCPLFEGLPGTFYTVMSHNDCFRSDEIRSLAKSEAWGIQAFQVAAPDSDPRPCVWGLQFHPEITRRDFEDICKGVNLDQALIVNESEQPEDFSLREIVAKNFVGMVSELYSSPRIRSSDGKAPPQQKKQQQREKSNSTKKSKAQKRKSKDEN